MCYIWDKFLLGFLNQKSISNVIHGILQWYHLINFKHLCIKRVLYIINFHLSFQEVLWGHSNCFGIFEDNVSYSQVCLVQLLKVFKFFTKSELINQSEKYFRYSVWNRNPDKISMGWDVLIYALDWEGVSMVTKKKYKPWLWKY